AKGATDSQRPKDEFSPPLRLCDSFAPLRETYQTNKASTPSLTLLTQLVGDANISSHDGTITVSPASAEEISEVLKLASSEGWTVVPAGGMRWLSSTANLIVST